MPKRRHQQEQDSESARKTPHAKLDYGESTPISHQNMSPAKAATSPVGDLDAQISDILTKVPANIRLTSAPTSSSEASEQRYNRTTSDAKASHNLRASRPSVKSPEMLLSPAKPEEAGSRRPHGDPEIRVYHLVQPGREKPIKLFIRRVGEDGERVMVRVGGGWADLGEYLRQYAEHHGRRTVSEGKLEVLGSTSESAPPVPVSMGKVPTPNVTPSKRQDQTTRSITPTPFPPNTVSNAQDTPDTTSSAGSRSSWKGDEVGLAGPAVKKFELSGEKKQWIDSMMDQARRVSSGFGGKEKDREKDKEKDFGDLGKVGGTRRLFMKGKGEK
jgi:hypothetical protein